MKVMSLKKQSCIIGYAIIITVFISSCALIGGFNAQSHEHITSLKASHLKFIDVFTEGLGKEFDGNKLLSKSDEVDLKFREALEFSKSLGDKLRTSNIQLLKGIFEEDFKNIKDKHRLLTTIEAKTLSDPSSQAYDRVIHGECARPSANCQ